MRVALALALGALALGGCGTEAHDLFVVDRTGAIPGAQLSLRITDDGRASCNDRPLVDITSAQLINARNAQRDLKDPAEAHVRLAPGPQPVLSYRVRTEDGVVTWSDDSARQPPVLFDLAKLTRDIAKGACHLAR
ncbi:MAG TPA: hypothetical protein VKB54_14680 [Solirubrobacteraceae bacterium]|nr:hypothetical protein [Solirubrobacteraceae bacterium]